MDSDEQKLATLLGANLKARRQAQGWTQAALAERAELSPHYIALLETAKKLPTLKALATLANALGITTGDLLKEFEGPASTVWLDDLCKLATSVPEQHRKLMHELVRVVVHHLQNVQPRKKSPTQAKQNKRTVVKSKVARR